MMTQKLGLLACLVAGGTMLLDGCKSAPAPAPVAVATPAQSTPTQYAVRNPDGSITNPDGSVTYPAGVKPPASATSFTNPNAARIVPAPARVEERREVRPATRVAPATGAYGTAPVAAAPVLRATVPAGTPVTVRINNGLAASRNNVGDRFSGTLQNALTTSSGATVFAAGTPVSGSVVAAKGKGRFKGAGDLGIELTAIGRDSVATSEYEKASPGRGRRSVEFGAGGAGLGALIGGLAGGGKGALIGGLAGAGAGTAAGAYTGNRDVVIPAESVVTFRLTQSITR